MTIAMTGGRLAVEVLKSLGVRHMFGVVGGQTLAITHAILESGSMEFVHTRHEGAAAVMADAYGRITGTPAACLATTGPGVTNLTTGVGGAYRDSSPALILTCNNAGENIHRDDAQNADHVALLRPLTKYSRLVTHASAIKQTLEEAFLNAVTGNPGPVHVDFARDVIEGEIKDPPSVPATNPLRDWVDMRPAPNPESVQKVAGILLSANKPALWLGAGATRSGAGDAVLVLADRLNIPVVTTFNGIGSVPTTHPRVFGAVSRMGTALSTRVIQEADLVLALGNSLNAVSTSRWRLALPPVVHVDIDPSMIGRYYSDLTTGVVADVGLFVKALSDALDGQAEAGARHRAPWMADLTEAKRQWWEAAAVRDASPAGVLSPADVVRVLREATPNETLLIADAGNPGVWSLLWDVTQPNTYVKPVGFGNMGFAVPAAIAASLIDQNRPVLALVGDGSLGMSLGELETLARTGGRVCVVVLNDSSYGNIRQEQEINFGGRTIGVDFESVDFGAVARGMGVDGETVMTLEVLRSRVKEIFAGNRPVLLDVPIDRDVNAWTFHSFQPSAV